MTENAESVLVRADMSALEFHEAAWEARATEATPPSPLTLSDRALAIVMAYAEADLPPETMGMLEDERRRRGMASTVIERLIGIGMLALIPPPKAGIKPQDSAPPNPAGRERSGWPDPNRRPPAPKAGALPG